MFPWHQYVLALIFLVGGFFHLQKSKLYRKITPPYIPYKNSMVLLTGIAEMVVAFMLVTKDSENFGAWGMIILLVLFFPVHRYMLQNKEASLKLPKWILILRIPLQFLLIYWAWMYT